MDFSSSIEEVLSHLKHYARPEVADGPNADLESIAEEAHSSAALDSDVYYSDVESDTEPVLVDQTFIEDADSDADSIDSDMDDPLRHAGVYTVEEIVGQTKDRLVKLQNAYIEQFRRLSHSLREQRRLYLHAVKKEKELQGYGKLKDVPSERKAVKKLKYLLRYHRVFGKENLLFLQAQEQRLKVTEGAGYKPPTIIRCCHAEDKLKCQQPVIPLSRFCSKHILEDKDQILFRPCGASVDTIGKEECLVPVLDLMEQSYCDYHASSKSVESGSNVR